MSLKKMLPGALVLLVLLLAGCAPGPEQTRIPEVSGAAIGVVYRTPS